MPSPALDPTLLAARLDRLEAQNRRLRLTVATLALAGLGLGAAGFARRPPTVIQAERFELVDAAGQRRALLTADSGAFSLVLYGRRGQPAAGLALSEIVPRLAVLNGAGRVMASLGEATGYPTKP
ncbi:MAG TPA: hypothetical protein VFS67_14430 [Polyangiaceae bacterium]|nr:hypothetical protein [Polyangiaceae bacterium]